MAFLKLGTHNFRNLFPSHYIFNSMPSFLPGILHNCFRDNFLLQPHLPLYKPHTASLIFASIAVQDRDTSKKNIPEDCFFPG